MDNQTLLVNWYIAYVEDQTENRHTIFAELLGVDRHEAKQIAYKIGYKISTSEIMEAYNL